MSCVGLFLSRGGGGDGVVYCVTGGGSGEGWSQIVSSGHNLWPQYWSSMGIEVGCFSVCDQQFVNL